MTDNEAHMCLTNIVGVVSTISYPFSVLSYIRVGFGKAVDVGVLGIEVLCPLVFSVDTFVICMGLRKKDWHYPGSYVQLVSTSLNKRKYPDKFTDAEVALVGPE